MARILAGETPNHIGESVSLCGWVRLRRDHGKLVFIDLADRSGQIQAVVIPDHVGAYEAAKSAKVGAILRVQGMVKERPMSAKNEDSVTGNVEMELDEI